MHPNSQARHLANRCSHSSLRRAIILLLSAPGRKKSHAARVNSYKIDTFDKDVFNIIFEQFELKGNATQKSVQLMNIIKSGCDASMIYGTKTLQTLEKNA